jgi:hypothetical protein
MGPNPEELANIAINEVDPAEYSEDVEDFDRWQNELLRLNSRRNIHDLLTYRSQAAPIIAGVEGTETLRRAAEDRHRVVLEDLLELLYVTEDPIEHARLLYLIERHEDDSPVVPSITMIDARNSLMGEEIHANNVDIPPATTRVC